MAGARSERRPAETGVAALSPLGRRLVDALARAQGRTVSRATLIEELWAGNHLVGEPALNRAVSEARRALKETGDGSIETVQRGGYRWVPQVADEPSRPSMTARYIPWALGFVAVLILLLVAGWVLEQATGMIWVARHGG